jgi:hypothetical protein
MCWRTLSPQSMKHPCLMHPLCTAACAHSSARQAGPVALNQSGMESALFQAATTVWIDLDSTRHLPGRTLMKHEFTAQRGKHGIQCGLHSSDGVVTFLHVVSCGSLPSISRLQSSAHACRPLITTRSH